MRIIAGKLKGRQVRPRRGSRIRPVTGAVLEQLMSLFTAERLGAGPFLDLCAGSGLVGLEATSRGAPLTVFVETDPKTASHIKRHLLEFDVAKHTYVIRTDVRRCATIVKRVTGGAAAACCMLDPPFIPGLADELLQAIGRHAELFGEDCLLICRTPDNLPNQTGCLQLVEQRTAGNAKLWLFRPSPPS